MSIWLNRRWVIKKAIFTLSTFFLLLLLIPGSYSQDLFEIPDEEIRLVIGELFILDVTSPKRVSMQDPEIADISKVSDKEIVISGKKVGTTDLIIWDSQGKKEFHITVFPKDLERIKKKLKELINKNLRIHNVYFRENEATGRIIILGEVTEIQKAQIEQVLEEYGDKDEAGFIDILLTVKQETKMVEIECQILEMSKNDLDDLGVEWNQFFDVREEPYSSTTSTSGVDTSLNRIAPWNGLWSITGWSRDAIISKINTLVQRGSGKVLSRPKLLCLSGEEAKLTVGGEVPYVSGSTTGQSGTSVNVEYKEYGVILTLSPTIFADERVLLNLSTEVSELDWANAITVASISVPAFSTRKADTVVNVVSGDTLFIGGLIKNKESTNIDKFPALGNIPIIGALFRSKRFQDDQTELVITLTPIVRESKKESLTPEATVAKTSQKSSSYATYPDYLRENSSLTNYTLRIQKLIFESLTYPRLAQDAGWQGAVKLKLHLDYQGQVLEARVSESSGYVSFDKDVVRIAKSLSPYPPIPPDVEIEDLWIDIPIVYRMEY
jgi:pilus assembly protein CpaC